MRALRLKLSRIPGLRWLRPKMEKPFRWQPPALREREARILVVVWTEGRTYEFGHTLSSGSDPAEVDNVTRKLWPAICKAMKRSGHAGYQGRNERMMNLTPETYPKS